MLFSMAAFCLLTVTTNKGAHGESVCPSRAPSGVQWSVFEGETDADHRVCYALNADGHDWKTGENTCLRETGGHLAAPGNSTDDWKRQFRGRSYFWIGGRKTVAEWQWTDGHKLGSFSNWETIKPVQDEIGDCALLKLSDQRNSTGNSVKWFQKDCLSSASAVCQTVKTSNNRDCSSVSADAIEFEDYCFTVFAGPPSTMTWYEASGLCSGRNASLAVFLFADVFDGFVAQFRRRSNAFGGDRSGGYWIGLRRSKWIWSKTGEEISSSFWGPKGLPPSSGDCLLLEAGLSVAAVGMDCNATKPFLCEINRTTVLMSTLGSNITSTSSFEQGTTRASSGRITERGVVGGLVFVVAMIIIVVIVLVAMSMCLCKRMRLIKERRGQPTTAAAAAAAYVNEGIRFDISDPFQVSMPVISGPNEVTRPPRVEGHDVIGHVGANGRPTEHAGRGNETGFGGTWNAQQHQHHQQSLETGEGDRAQWSIDLKDMLNDLQEGQLSDRQEGQLSDRQEGQPRDRQDGQLSDRQEGQLSDRQGQLSDRQEGQPSNLQGQSVDFSGDKSFLSLLESEDFLPQDAKHLRNFSPPDSLDRNFQDLTFDDSANHDASKWTVNNPVIHDIKDPTSVDSVNRQVGESMPNNSVNLDVKDTASDV